MRTFIIAILICLTSCKSKYSANRYTIPKNYRDLIGSYKIGDTLKFSDNKANLFLYLITVIDSSFVDEGRGLMSVRGSKDIVIYCRELTNPRKGYEEYPMIILNRYPDEDSATFDLRLKDFYSIDTTEAFELKRDTIVANNLSFTNYYCFRANNYTEQKDSNSVAKVYMTKEGILAYRNLNGVWWTKVR